MKSNSMSPARPVKGAHPWSRVACQMSSQNGIINVRYIIVMHSMRFMLEDKMNKTNLYRWIECDTRLAAIRAWLRFIANQPSYCSWADVSQLSWRIAADLTYRSWADMSAVQTAAKIDRSWLSKQSADFNSSNVIQFSSKKQVTQMVEKMIGYSCYCLLHMLRTQIGGTANCTVWHDVRVHNAFFLLVTYAHAALI